MSDDYLYYPVPEKDWRVTVCSNEASHAVTVLHLPTGITATCSEHPSHIQCRSEAFRRAEKRIAQLTTQHKEEEIS